MGGVILQGPYIISRIGGEGRELFHTIAQPSTPPPHLRTSHERSQRFDFSSNPPPPGPPLPGDRIGGIALDSYGPRKDLKGRGRGVTNRPAWMEERERKGLQTYDFVNK